MNRIEDLIQKFCPNGVEFKEIRQLAEVGTGSSNGNEAQEDGIYPFFIRSQTVKRKNDWEYDEEAIIIPGEGGIGEIYHYVNGKYAIHQRVYRIHFIDSTVDTKYAYHYFRAFFKNFIMRKAVSATVKSIRKPMIEEFELPVPPLEVQREIVRVLDSFTLLTAELTAELTARKKQYAFYRNQLLSFDTKVERKKLGDIFDFRNGLSKGKEFFGRGIPFIRYTDVYNHRALRKEDITALVECTTDEMNKLRVNRGDVLFTRTSETAEDIGWSSVMLADLEECVFNGFTIKATPKTNDLLPEYCAYCFSTYSFRDFVTRKCAFTTRASLTGNTIGEYEMAIPSHEVQKRIVEVLDNFEQICNDLSIGLPAEIEARQKQYEYYRDLLFHTLQTPPRPFRQTVQSLTTIVYESLFFPQTENVK